MATCKDCGHYSVCGMTDRVVCVDKYVWNDFGSLENVEDYCKYYFDDMIVEELHKKLVKMQRSYTKIFLENLELSHKLRKVRGEYNGGENK